jgi:hypothetical protein
MGVHMLTSLHQYLGFFNNGCDTEFTIIVLFTIFITHFCPCVIITSGKWQCADERPKDKKNRKVMSLFQKWRYWEKLGRGTSNTV